MDIQSLCKLPVGWQPIETAPRDGTPVLLFAEGTIFFAAFYQDGTTNILGRPMRAMWHGANVRSELTPVTRDGEPIDFPKIWKMTGCEPSHWMPLPAAPIA